MSLYFLKSNEYNLLKSFKEEILFVEKHIDHFIENDLIVFLINDEIAGLAELTDNQLKLNFTYIFNQGERPPMFGIIRNLLLDEWDRDIDGSLEALKPVSQNTTKHIIKELNKYPSNLGFFLTEIDYLLEEQDKVFQNETKKLERQKTKEKLKNLIPTPQESEIPTTDHNKAQHYLKELAMITNCDIWMANNDKNKIYDGEKLGSDDLENFPAFHMEQDTKKRISLIDTIWFKNDIPISCFEVETSTSVYSGLLRMGDLVATMPSMDLKIYIVAPEKRRSKVLNEINRPVFKAIGLHKVARFISIENLEVLYKKVKGLNGFVTPQVIDAIALNLDELKNLN